MSINETHIQRSTLRLFREALPAEWSVQPAVEQDTNGGESRRVWYVAAPDGSRADLNLEVRDRLYAREVLQLAARFRGGRVPIPLVLARYLSPRTRERLGQAGINYADSTGNVCIQLDRPALFLRMTGTDKDPDPPRHPLSSLRGPGAARAVRALVDFRLPRSMRQLSTEDEVLALEDRHDMRALLVSSGHIAARFREYSSVSAISRVARLLEYEGLLERAPDGSIEQLDWPGVIRRWTEDYGLLKSHKVHRYLDPRGLSSFEAKLPALKGAQVLTGSLAVPPEARVAPARLATLYTWDPNRDAEALSLVPAETGANVLLIEPFDLTVISRLQDGGDPDVCRVGFSLLAADLLTSPGRGPAEGEALLEWMAANEDHWRRGSE